MASRSEAANDAMHGLRRDAPARAPAALLGLFALLERLLPVKCLFAFDSARRQDARSFDVRSGIPFSALSVIADLTD